MERIAIINHDTHQLIVVDIPLQVLEDVYQGEEEKYITDNYPNITNYSWDYISDSCYVDIDNNTFELEPTEWCN